MIQSNTTTKNKSPDPRYYSIEEVLRARQQAGLRRYLSPRETKSTLRSERINLCSNDYLGLSQDARVIAGAQAAAARWGAGAGSSRLLAGELPCFGALEDALADFLGTESALLFNTGYQANLGLLTALSGAGGFIFSDQLNHASLIDGCRLGSSEVVVYPHNDAQELSELLRRYLVRSETAEKMESGERAEAVSGPSVSLVVTEGVFSMDGDLAPIGALRQAAERHGAIMIVDDAHALGVLGDGGRGTAWSGAPDGGADIVVGTFGKAFGAAGAFVAGPKLVREALINLARTFVFTTGPCPAAVGAAHAALDIIKQDPEPRTRLLTNVNRVREGLESLGLDLHSSVGHIIPIVVGSERRALEFSRLLLDAGIEAPAIRPPTVPPGTSRLRISISASHSPEQLDYAVESIGRLYKKLESDGWE